MTSHYKEESQARSIPICPSCNKPAQERDTKYGIRCACYQCDLWSWDRYPLVDRDTHATRRRAHLVFDNLWKSGILSRGMAYRALQQKLNLKDGECHIKLMNKKLALQVPNAVAEILTEMK